MLGLIQLGNTFRWGVQSVDVVQPVQQYSKIGGPITDAGDITLSPVAVNALGDVTGAVSYDWNNGWILSVRLTGNTTITFSNPLSGMEYCILVIQDGTGSRTLTLVPTPVWPGGAGAVAVNSTASQRTQVYLLWDGTSYHARMVKTGNG